MRVHRVTSRKALALVGGLTSLILVAGCSSGSSSSSASASPSSTATADAASPCAAQAAAKVAEASKPVQFPAPSAPVNMAKAQGKKVWYIAPDLSIPFIASIAKGFSDGAKAAGMVPTVFDGKGNVNTFNQGVSSAVAQKANAILLQGINPALVSGPLAQAVAAKTVIVDSLNGGGPEGPLTGGVQAHVTVDYSLGGRLLADAALARSGCTGELVFFTSSIFTVYVDMLGGFKSEITTLCPACSAPVVVDIAPTDLATKMPTLTTTQLTLHPTAKVFLAAYDGMVGFMAPSLQEAKSKVFIIGHDGVDSNLQQILKGGSPQVATVSNPPNEAMGWGEVDQIGRLLTRAPAVVALLPQQVMDATNIAADPTQMFPGYSTYKDQYKKLWGVG
jgi:ribose transport system substrate-binding protein